MSRHIDAAREAVESASEITDDSTVHEQLDSITRGLDSVSDEEGPTDDYERGDRLEELESKLVGLGDEADDDVVVDYLRTARDHIDAYRQDAARDW